LPIQADFVGKKVPASRTEIVDVHIKELDGEDCVMVHYEKGNKKEAKKAKNTSSRIKLQRTPKQKVKQLTMENTEEDGA
jgi:hypothetical protein